MELKDEKYISLSFGKSLQYLSIKKSLFSPSIIFAMLVPINLGEEGKISK